MTTDTTRHPGRGSAATRYRPEPDEAQAPPMVFCLAAGDWRPDCVPGCFNYCWSRGDACGDDEPLPDAGPQVDLPF